MGAPNGASVCGVSLRWYPSLELGIGQRSGGGADTVRAVALWGKVRLNVGTVANLADGRRRMAAAHRSWGRLGE